MMDEIAASDARVWLLARGASKHEIFAARAFERHPGIGFLSVGVSLNYLAGSQTRVPARIRASAVEWLYRLLGNPRRHVGRYAACAPILPGLTFDRLGQRCANG